MSTFQSAEIVKTAEGKQYHIGLKPGEVSPYILMCGDVERVDKIGKLLDNVTAPIRSREYITISGSYKGVPVTVMATGMGPDNTEIALVELSQVVKQPTFIRIGTSGGLQKECAIGDLVISSGAVRLENTSTQFVHSGYPAVAHHEVVMALIQAAANHKAAHHVGLTATAPGFYGAQGRTTPHFKPLNPEIPAQLAEQNVMNFEMEASCLFTLSTLANYRAGAVCVVVANRHANQFSDEKTKKDGEMRAIMVGLEAVVLLAAMDKAKGKSHYWVPSMGL